VGLLAPCPSSPPTPCSFKQRLVEASDALAQSPSPRLLGDAAGLVERLPPNFGWPQARGNLQTLLLRHKLPMPSFDTIALPGPPTSFSTTVRFSSSASDHQVSGGYAQRKKEADGLAALAALRFLNEHALLPMQVCPL
jgi:hypothetical protein